jgi:hypothetical protein
MGLVARWTALVAAVVGVGLLGGCGGSVADADTDRPRASTTVAAPSPFCAAARANSEAIRPLNLLASDGSRPQSLMSAVDEVRRTGTELVRVAPDEIRPDVERTVLTVNLQLDALVRNNGDTAAMARDPELAARISSPEVTASGERYRDYVGRTCGPASPARGTG